jgi:capsular exopolysaccharide synthesis family protein
MSSPFDNFSRDSIDPNQSHQATTTLLRVEEYLDFRRIYFLLIKKLWVIALVVAIGLIATLGWLARQPRIYESRAVLEVELQEHKVLKEDDDVSQGLQSQDFVNTVVEALTSKNIMLRVIRANNLEQNPTFAPHRLGGGHYTEDQLAAMMQAKVNVKLRKLSRVIDITVEDQSPELACTLATSFVREFLRESFEQRLSISRVSNEFLRDEAAKLKQKLANSELELQRYKEQNNAVSLEESQNIIVTKLQEMNTAQTDAKNERLKLEADLEQIKRSDPSKTDELLKISSVAAIPQVVSVRQELLAAQSELDTLKEHYLPKHPKYIAAVNKIEGLNASLREAVRKAGDQVNQQYESAKETEAKMDAALKEQENRALELNKLAIPYNVLSREVDADKALYDSVISRMNQSGITAMAENSPYRIIEEPLIPSKPSKPKRLITLVMALFILTLASSIVIVLIDSISTAIRSVDDAETTFGIPVLSAIPDQSLTPPEKAEVILNREIAILPSRIEILKRVVEELRQKKKQGRQEIKQLLRKAPRLASEEETKKYPIAMLDLPSSPLAEAYRTLRAAIALLGRKEQTRVLLFTSSVPEEGKTFTSINCAVSLAQQGQKTIIIDSDLRRPSIHRALLNSEVRPGLAELLAGLATLDEVISPSIVPNLFVISAGNRCPNPAELLAQADIPALITNLEARFERLIFDSSPINAVSDTLFLVSAVGKVILIIRADSTPRQVVQRAVKLLHKAGASMAGIVLNRMSRGASAGYYYYYYGDKYLKDSVYGTSKES